MNLHGIPVFQRSGSRPMERDMAEGVSEMVFADTSIFSGGYPELTERLAKMQHFFPFRWIPRTMQKNQRYWLTCISMLRERTRSSQRRKRLLRFLFLRQDKYRFSIFGRRNRNRKSIQPPQWLKNPRSRRQSIAEMSGIISTWKMTAFIKSNVLRIL